MNFTKEIVSKSSHISFHTPSHCNTLSSDLLLCDTTELPYSDNLLSPIGIIKDLQNDIAALYHSAACFISTQGATSSVMSAIYAAKSYGAMLIVGNAHISVYNAMRLFNIKAYHIDKIDSTTIIPNDVVTVILTSPDYFGNCLPLANICLQLKGQNKYIIVDAAHGGHFIFSDKLPLSATLYADMVIHSVHKTLPVATGGSLLLCKDATFISKIIIARSMLHSSSPSYFVLCSISDAFMEYQKNGKTHYDNIYSAIKHFITMLPSPFTASNNDDFTRLVVCSPYCGEDVYNTLAILGIYAEMSYENKVVFIVNNANYKHLPKLLKAFVLLKDAILNTYKKPKINFTSHKEATLLSFGEDFEIVPIKDALHRQLFKEIGFYPPGVPIFYSGHLLQSNDIDILIKYNKILFGLDNSTVCVVK